MIEISDEIKNSLKALVDHFDSEDQYVREKQIRQWKKYKLYWDGLQRIWYDEVAHDWRVWSETTDIKNDAVYYDKPVNVYRAYLESIIAALSINIPAIICFPEDATNPNDITTAKAGNKISKVVYRHNEVVLLWLHALYIYCTEGLIACYNYSKEDVKFGTYQEDKFESKEEEHFQCPNCKAVLEDNIFDVSDDIPEETEVMDENLMVLPQPKVPTCPECGWELDENLEKQKVEVKRLIGTITKPKSRQCLEVYGGLYVKVPNYAMRQENCPYLIWEYETHFTNVISRYEELAKKFGGRPEALVGISEEYERWGRLPIPYNGEYPQSTVTVRNCWFRPSAYYYLAEEKRKELEKEFPSGVKVVYANEEFAEAIGESLDDCWTLSKNPLSDYIHHDPLGSLLISIQDMTNDMLSLILQTIEHGVPQTFVDPTVIDFEAYKKSEAAPGMIYPTKPQPAGSNIGNSVATLQTASLSPEVMPFGKTVQDLGQLVSGALPSLFGGQAQAGSKTASEYAMSRAQALQRLQTPWKTLTIWWKEIFGKVIPAYMEDIVDDERIVERNKDGGFENIIIQKAELQGKIGRIELDASENVPITMQQKKDVLLQLMQFANPVLIEAMTSPENIPFIKEALGLEEIIIPGEDDRQKQYEEIQALLESEPMESIDPMMGTPIQVPSVQVDPLLDNHQVEAEICRAYLISEVGRNTKVTNPTGYLNVLLHMKEHMQFVMMQQMQAQAQMQEGEPNGEGKPNAQNKKGKDSPPDVEGESDVQAPIH